VSGLSILVLTQDEGSNLPALLESIEGLDHQLFVMDSGSTDATVAIAEGAGATVFSHPFDNYGAQRNRAQALLPDPDGWVLHMDADERLTPELKDEIAGVMQSGRSGVDGYMLRQRTVFMGRWIRHGGHYPSFHLRLFRIAAGRCEDRLYDQHFVVDGRVEQLRHDYIDTIGSDLYTWTMRHARWARLEVEEQQLGHGDRKLVEPRLRGTPIEKKRWLRAKVLDRGPLFFRSFGYWVYRYFFRLGFLDGREGLIFHFLQGFWFRFLIDSMTFEAARGRDSGG
jgi:glycosyltransferase involved in cell wall biosynthesis